MLKQEKVEFVRRAKEEVKRYKTVGIMPIEALPDRLVQRIRNGMKPDGRMLVARKNLILKILEGGESLKALEGQITGNVAIVLSNKDPLDLYAEINGEPMKLGAKPNQIAPSDIRIEAGETAIAPGQAVTDLKTAGIDVKIDKGKVVISKAKVLVAKGERITTPVAKALKMLEVMPFEARGRLSSAVSENLLFGENALRVNKGYMLDGIGRCFSQAHALTLAIGFITPYNAAVFISRAANEALALGIEARVYEKGITEKLVGIASAQASGLNSLVKKETDA